MKATADQKVDADSRLVVPANLLRLANSHKINEIPVLPGAVTCILNFSLANSSSKKWCFDICDFLAPIIPDSHLAELTFNVTKDAEGAIGFYLEGTGLVSSIKNTKQSKIGKNRVDLANRACSVNKKNFYKQLKDVGIDIEEPLALVIEAEKRDENELLTKIKYTGFSAPFEQACFVDALFHGGLILLSGAPMMVRSIKDFFLDESILEHGDFVFCNYKRLNETTLEACIFNESGQQAGCFKLVAYSLPLHREHNVKIVSDYTVSPIAQPLRFFNTLLGNTTNYSFVDNANIFDFLCRQGSKTTDIVMLQPEKLLGWNKLSYLKENHPVIKHDEAYHQALLENGILLHGLNQYETDYLYREICLQRVYFDHIELPESPVIIDIGANIGMFGVATKDLYPNAEIISLEPIPHVCNALKLNYENYSIGKVYNYAICAEQGKKKFRFYKNSSVFSHLIDSENYQDMALKKAIGNSIHQNMSSTLQADSEPNLMQQFIESRLDYEDITCDAVSLSNFMTELKLKQVDLLKIDAEGSEKEILATLHEADWGILNNIVVEAHSECIRDEIVLLLKSKGYEVYSSAYEELEGVNYFNIYASRQGLSPKTFNEKFLEQSFDKLDSAIQLYRKANNKTPIFCLTANSPKAKEGAVSNLISDVTAQLKVRLEKQGVDLIDLSENYSNVYDRLSAINARIPYTNEYWVELAESLSRKLFNKLSNQFKVICVDCDNTLWQGICAEQPINELKLTEANLLLQSKLLEMKRQGILVAILSKNDVSHVKKVFADCPGMLLQEDDIAFWYVNWQSKSENIQKLAHETGLALKHIVHIDDNPVEVADLRMHVANASAVLLPEDDAARITFLNNLWILDGGSVITDEDQKRTDYYHQEQLRLTEKISYSSAKAFIDSLALKVDLKPVETQHLHRASELTFRTNQFNNDKQLWSELDIEQYLSGPGNYGYTVSVRDKFGSYGVVALILATQKQGQLIIKQWCMSCRVFHRGVESRILEHLAKICSVKGMTEIVIPYRDTAENRQIIIFIEKLRGLRGIKDEKSSVIISTKAILENDIDKLLIGDECDSRREVKQDSDHQQNISLINLENIALYCSMSAEKLSQLIFGNNGFDNTPPTKPPVDNTHETLRSFWEQFLKIKCPNDDVSFFDLGGSSIELVQLANMIGKRWQLDLPIYALYKNNSINQMASYIDSCLKRKEK